MTRRQLEVFDAIQACNDRFGRSPTYRELAGLINSKPVAAFEHVACLEQMGFVTKEHHRIRILKRPARRPTLLLCIGEING